jgi:hypothetical protein
MKALVILLFTAFFIATPGLAVNNILSVPATETLQGGSLSEGIDDLSARVISNEPGDSNAKVVFVFDLEGVKFQSTPMARLRFVMEKLNVRRAGQTAQTGRGALHAFVSKGDGRLIGSAAVKPGHAVPYVIDITNAVSEALARPAGHRRLSVEVRMLGKPAFFEVYGLVPESEHGPARLEIASPEDWTNDWAQRLRPLDAQGEIYREGCMAITENPGTKAVVQLLFPAKHIVEVIHNGTGEKLEEGRDWRLRDDGQLVLPPGTRAPVQIASEFFINEKLQEDGTVKRTPSSIRLVEGTFYHERQIEVTYEPETREWKLPAAISKPADLPRFQRLLSEKAPIQILLFGDSISYGGNASKVEGGWPWQPAFGELVAWDLARRSGSTITFMNHSRGGAGVEFGLTQAASQAGWFQPDLVVLGYGMNDRRDERRAIYKQTLEAIIDAIRAESPQTEFVIVTSMLNNPKQSTGLGPILELRDLALSIDRHGVAFADMTTVHQHLLERKNYLDTSGNGANHPNDYLQRIYAQLVLKILSPHDSQDSQLVAKP